jgi:DNA-binding NarL/FixJ family response regulator
MEKSIKLLLVDNHILVRSGMHSLLSTYDDFNIIGETGLEECVSCIQTCPPDVVILSIQSNDPFYSSSLVLQILQSCPQTHVLIIANSAEDKRVMEAFRQGAMGCLLANSHIDELYQSIISLSAGGSYLPPSVGKKLILGYNHTGHQKTRQTRQELSTQQLQVLRQICQGCTNQKIAESLGISKRTVEMHAYKIFKKLKVTNRFQAIQAALHLGLIDAYDWSPEPDRVLQEE